MLDFAVLYEQADWDRIGVFTEDHHLDVERILDCYMSAVKYSDSTFNPSGQRMI